MKIIDKNGRLFGKVSLIDILVIIIVLLLAAGIYLRFFHLETTASIGQPSQPIAYSLRVSSVRSFTVDAIAEGDEIFSKSQLADLGVITSVATEPAKQWNATVDGRTVLGEVEDKYDILLTVEGSGVVSDGRYYLDRVEELGLNQEFNFATKYCAFSGTVTAIEAA